ncbi:MAG: fmt, methionyl-tRNA formyltransferase [Candidatus Saccharibacteria bacterium]|nr:fmt, methionyl-tRNA formyltransferase [Candidatus Saccharibacteria bacterium]
MTQDRLIYFGTDAFSVPPLIQLLSEDREVVAVVTKPDSRTGRGRELSSPAVKRLADARGIPVLQPDRLPSIAAEIKQLKPSSGVVVAYGKIIPQSIIDLFPKGLINIHPSLLPRYRGPSPIESAILNGDDVTGVTLMQLDAEMDTGPTYDAAKLQLTGKETRPDLYEQLAELGASHLSAKLDAILEGRIVPIPQDKSLVSITRLLEKSDGDIDWSQPADQIEREIRAYLLWPSSRTELAGTQVTITSAHTQPASGQPGLAFRTAAAELAVYAGEGSLIVDTLKPAGKREMTGPEFLAGHPLPERI